MYLVICFVVDSPAYMFFYEKIDQAVWKYAEINNYGDARIYHITNKVVERYYPETSINNLVKFGEDLA